MHLVDITSCIIMHHEYRIIRNALCIMHHALSLDQGNLSLVGCLQLKDLYKDTKFDIHTMELLCIMHHA
jgi:hypothetical protein